jgi:hypothetical protein
MNASTLSGTTSPLLRSGLRRAVCACVYVLLCSHSGDAQATRFYDTLHNVLLDTFAKTKVEGFMNNEISEKFNKQFKMTGPVIVRSELVRFLANPDCAHFKVVFTKKGVMTPKGKTDANLRTEMDYCKDGSPPSTGKSS